ncbi:hypothetical protein CLOM_g6042, partial [Closterium sp. NIES-68]
FLTVRMFFFKS